MIDTIFENWLAVLGLDTFQLFIALVVLYAIFYPIIERWLHSPKGTTKKSDAV